MSSLLIAVFVLEGVAAVFFGLWLGERKARIYMQNWQQFGTPDPLKRAVVLPQELQAVDGKPDLRIMRREDTPPAVEFDPGTIENGVQFLLNEARMRGESLSEEDARDEAIRMLNAEGPEMP